MPHYGPDFNPPDPLLTLNSTAHSNVDGSVHIFCTAVQLLLQFLDFVPRHVHVSAHTRITILITICSYFGSEAFGQQHRSCYDTLWASEGHDSISHLGQHRANSV